MTIIIEKSEWDRKTNTFGITNGDDAKPQRWFNLIFDETKNHLRALKTTRRKIAVKAKR